MTDPVIGQCSKCGGSLTVGHTCLNMLEMIAELRGGIPEKCDFCEQPFTDERYPTPEEAGAWACIECVDRWGQQEAARAGGEKL